MIDGMAGERARSREGHAAMSMTGAEDRWREMQQDTFTNWANEHLKNSEFVVNDLTVDLCDGTILVALVETLQGKSLVNGVNKKRRPTNQHQCLENVTVALKALTDDKIKLVNIGSEDIVEGNDKLIMGLLWLMILRYQIGKTKVPPKKLMLGWINATLPDSNIGNFTNDWNDGVALHALLNYCDPRLSPNWKQLDRSKKLENCTSAMNTARTELHVPMVLAPEYMASPHLDELSAMTYLSYFIKPKSAGYDATLTWVRKTLPDRRIENFTTDWRDGVNLCLLANAMGADIPGHPKYDPKDKIGNIQKGLDGGAQLGIQPVLTAKEIAAAEVDHLGMMAYVSKFRHAQAPIKKPKLVPVVNAAPVNDVQTKVSKEVTKTEEVIKPSWKRQVDSKSQEVNKHIVTSQVETKTEEVIKPSWKSKTDTAPAAKTSKTTWSSQEAEITVTSSNPVNHEMIVAYQEQQVESSPNQFMVAGDVGRVTVPKLQPCVLGCVQEIKIPGAAATGTTVKVEARTPTGRVIDLPVRQEKGQYVVRFTPAEAGDWQLSVLLGGKHAAGSPASMTVYDPQQIKVIKPESLEAVLGNPVAFNVDCASAGQGKLKAQGLYNGKSFPVIVTADQRGSYIVSYLPVGPGKHSVRVHFNDSEIKGSPFVFNIADPESVSVYGPGLTSSAVNKDAEFILHADGVSKDDVKVVVKDPKGRFVPSQVKRHGDDYKILYQPNSIGRYSIEVYVSGHLLNSAPYYVDVHDPQSVLIAKNYTAIVGQLSFVDVDVRSAGSAELDVIVKAPNGQTIPHSKQLLGDKYHVTYTPRQPGHHIIHLSYGGVPLKNSPVTQTIGAGEDLVDAHGDGLHRAEELVQASFTVDTHQAHGDLDVKVEGPNSISKHQISPQSRGQYVVTYNPVEVGHYQIHVLWNKRHIPESPFSAQVVCPERVTVVGGWHALLDNDGTLPLKVNNETVIKFNIEHAGPGILTSRVIGPRGADVPSQVINNHVVRFTPKHEGDHSIHFRWSDYELSDSPIRGRAAPDTLPVDATKVLLSGDGLHEATVHEQSEFRVDGGLAGPGKLKANMSGGKTDVEVRVTPNGNDTFTCHYVPLIPGAYLLNVLWSDKAVTGSPFKVSVSLRSDPGQVLCSGEGLRSGVMGKDIKALIDTRRAGPGELSAQCIGPHKPAYCELYDHRDGTYNLNIKPQEPGRHILHIKFADEHVPGSPYVVKVSGAPDASKVRVTGPGTEPGVLSTFQSRFICETRGAGAGQLTVRIRGPKGAFRVEMQRESQKDRTILCRYDPTETGEYIIHVKWSGDHVQGSPFHVRIFNAEHELEKFLIENPDVTINDKSWNAQI